MTESVSGAVIRHECVHTLLDGLPGSHSRQPPKPGHHQFHVPARTLTCRPSNSSSTVKRDDNRISVEPATAPPLARLDHLVLTVVSIEDAVRFYTRVLGMTEVVFGAGRRALAFGEQKLNLHQAGDEFDPKAAQPTPGSPQLPLCVRAKDMKTLFPFSRYSPKGPHSLNPTLPYRV